MLAIDVLQNALDNEYSGYRVQLETVEGDIRNCAQRLKTFELRKLQIEENISDIEATIAYLTERNQPVDPGE